MIKKILMIAAGLLSIQMCCASCGDAAPVSSGTEDVTADSTVPSTETEPETEPEEESPYLIPKAARVDFSTFSPEMFKATFKNGAAATAGLAEDGAKFTATKQSRDPYVFFRIDSMYEAAGYPADENGCHVPFTASEKKVLVLKVSAEWGGAFEMFYTTGKYTEVKNGRSIISVYGGDSESFGVRTDRYVIFNATSGVKGWSGAFNNGFRFDYTNYAEEGDEFLLKKIAFCADLEEAEKFIEEDRGVQPEPAAVEPGYYVCLYEDRLGEPKDNVKGEVYASLDEAKAACDKQKKYGYRVANEKGEIVYTPYTLLQCDLLREGHYITEYARKTKFKYGDSCTNPGINHRPLRTSCDRLVDWILYRTGFTDQPLVQGCVVSNLVTWCRDSGFEKITDKSQLQPGDIIFVRPDRNGGPQHTFMIASEVDKKGNSLRYDHGSDTRIMSKQPSSELFDKPEAPFICAYRPVVTAENNVFSQRYGVK